MLFVHRLLATLTVAGALWAGPAAAQDFKANLVAPDTLTVGTSGSAPPFSMTGPSGDLDGFDIDVANRIGKELGLKVVFKQFDFAGLLPGLASGQFDMIASGVTRTPQRLAATDFFLLSPYIVNGVAVTRRSDSPEITGWKSVCGKVMGAVRGGAFQKTAREKLPPGCVTEVREYPGATELFLDLKNKRIDFAAHDFLGPNYLVRTGKVDGIVVVPDVLAPITQSVAVGPKNKVLADRIDALFVGWRKDGTLKALGEKWFGASLDWSAAD
ncbi:substrate-binding periplasmic protein [Prosthecomicrobium sp. N25]|uniref:substrate-binding periplasmic protein n=1 Tax=Prosthecomicrobium sp. N25 TaxID=3129254 RepID=UPI0030784F3B